MGGHDDKVGANFTCQSTDFIEWRSAAQDMTPRRWDAALVRQRVKLTRNSFFRLLLICRYRKW
jgi:hypothetical protein